MTVGRREIEPSVAHGLIARVSRENGTRRKACEQAVRSSGLETPDGYLIVRGSAFFLQEGRREQRCACVRTYRAPNGDPYDVVEFNCPACRGKGMR